MNYFAIQCFPDTYNLVREGPNIDPHVTDLMVRAKKILGHEGRCVTCYSIHTPENSCDASQYVFPVSVSF